MSEVASRRASWERDFGKTLRELEGLTRQLDAARDQTELQSFGLYESDYDSDSSAGFKTKLDEIRGQQKAMVRSKTAAVCETEWQVGDSKAKGRQMTDRYLRRRLRTFNGECDATVVKVRYNNVTALERGISRAFETLNKLCESLHDRRDCGVRARSRRLRRVHPCGRGRAVPKDLGPAGWAGGRSRRAGGRGRRCRREVAAGTAQSLMGEGARSVEA